MILLLSINGCAHSKIKYEKPTFSKNWKVLHFSDKGPDMRPDFVRCIDFVDSKKGWIAGPNIPIMITENGGESWKSLGIYADTLDFIDNKIGWIAKTKRNESEMAIIGAKTGVTFDGGRTWNWSFIPKVAIKKIIAISSKEAWAIARRGNYCDILLHTNNGPGKWEIIQNPVRKIDQINFEDIIFIDKNKGWILARKDLGKSSNDASLYILGTADGGKTFYNSVIRKIKTGGSFVISFAPTGRGWIAYGGDSLLYSNDYGKHWQIIKPKFDNLEFSINGCATIGADIIWGITSHSVFFSQDNGRTWRKSTTGFDNFHNVEFKSIYFLDNKSGYILAEGGSYGSDTPPMPEHRISFIMKYHN